MVCGKCGKCCRGIVFIAEMPFPSVDLVNYYLYHNVVLENMGDGRVKFLVNNKCVNLGNDNLCKIFDDRPSFCRTIPEEGFGFCFDGCIERG